MACHSLLAEGMASTAWRTSSTRSTPLAPASNRHWSAYVCMLCCCCYLVCVRIFTACGLQASNFLWPFKLSSPKGGFINKRRSLANGSCRDTQEASSKASETIAQATAFARRAEVTGATARTAPSCRVPLGWILEHTGSKELINDLLKRMN